MRCQLAFKLFCLATLLIILIPPSNLGQQSSKNEQVIGWDPRKTKPTPSISVVHLLSRPEKYNNRKVYVFGYLHHKFEDHNLYLSKDDADHICSNRISLCYSEKLKAEDTDNNAISLERADDQFVHVVGTFKMSPYFDEGSYFGPATGCIESCELVGIAEAFYHKPITKGKRSK